MFSLCELYLGMCQGREWGGYMEVRDKHQVNSTVTLCLLFLRQTLSFSKISWVSSCCNPPVSKHPPPPRAPTHKHHQRSRHMPIFLVLHWWWAAELRSSWMCSKNFIHWAFSPVLTYLFKPKMWRQYLGKSQYWNSYLFKQHLYTVPDSLAKEH